jgi:hypothetical protein
LWRERRSAGGYAFWPFGAGASLIALLQYLANHGSDRLLISHRQCRHDRRELGTVHIGVERDRVFLEDATLSFKQPFEIYTVVCTENLSSGVVVVKSAKDGV